MTYNTEIQMPLARAGGRNHHIRYLGSDTWELSWSYEVKYGRLLGYRNTTRITDRKGAEKFAKKWGCDLLEAPKPHPIVPYFSKAQCQECMCVREVYPATREGGGTYRRGGRVYKSSVCLECARELLASLTPGHWSVNRWNIRPLQRIVEANA